MWLFQSFWIVFLETSRRFDLSSRSLGHVMFSSAGDAQEAGAGGRLGAAGIPVHGSLMGRFSLCIWLLSLFFWSIVALWSPTPVGMVRLLCSLKRFPSGRLVSPMYTCAGSWSHVISYMTPHFLSFRCTRMERRMFTGHVTKASRWEVETSWSFKKHDRKWVKKSHFNIMNIGSNNTFSNYMYGFYYFAKTWDDPLGVTGTWFVTICLPALRLNNLLKNPLEGLESDLSGGNSVSSVGQGGGFSAAMFSRIHRRRLLHASAPWRQLRAQCLVTGARTVTSETINVYKV